MAVNEETLEAAIDELRQIRARLDKLAVVLIGEQQKVELFPIWDCGHRHKSRGEAMECKRKARSTNSTTNATATLTA